MTSSSRFLLLLAALAALAVVTVVVLRPGTTQETAETRVVRRSSQPPGLIQVRGGPTAIGTTVQSPAASGTKLANQTPG